MAFTLSFTSVDGYITGYLKGADTLSNATIGGAPTESTTGMNMYNFRKDGAIAAGGEWMAYYQPAVNQAGDLGDINDFYNYLQTGGYDLNNPLVVCAFELQYNGNPTGKHICLMARDGGNGNVTSYVAVRVKSGNTWIYTPITNAFTLNVSYITKYGMVAGIVTVSGQRWFSMGFAYSYADYYVEAALWGNTESGLATALGGFPSGEEMDPDLGPASEPGGYGPDGGPAPTFDGNSDNWVDTPTKPGIAALGLVNLYKCNVSSLVNLGAELFPDIHWPTSLSDIGEVIAAVSDSIWNSKLIDYIISAHIIPVDVTAGSATDIKVGTRTMLGIRGEPITNDVVEVDCGTVHIDEYYTNFVDYLTKCRVYIPGHGFVEIAPEYWQSADLQLKYIFNVIDGSFVAKLYSTVSRHQKPFTALIGQYTGCMCVHVPMTGQSYASMFGGMIASAGGMAAGFASGNVGAAATSALNGFALAGGGGGMQMSNPYNASAGFYGHAKPYVIIERPISHYPTGYAREKGFPLLVTKKIGNCRGLTICESAVLNFACSDDEAAEILAALREGVIV